MKNKFIVISGLHLKALRESKGLNQDDLAPKIGRARQTIVTWEGKPKVKIEIDVAVKLAKVLDVPIEDLTKDKTFQKKPSFRDEIFEGDYIGMHKRVWTEHELTMATHRDLLRDLVATVKNLTQAGNG